MADLAVEALGEEVQVEAGNLFLQDILFIDIETVPQAEDYDKLSTPWQKLWDKKAARLAQNDESPQELYPRAGIYAEFGKIICISVGYIHEGVLGRQIRLKSFFHDDRRETRETNDK